MDSRFRDLETMIHRSRLKSNQIKSRNIPDWIELSRPLEFLFEYRWAWICPPWKIWHSRRDRCCLWCRRKVSLVLERTCLGILAFSAPFSRTQSDQPPVEMNTSNNQFWWAFTARICYKPYSSDFYRINCCRIRAKYLFWKKLWLFLIKVRRHFRLNQKNYERK